MKPLFRPFFSVAAVIRGAAGIYAMAAPASFLSWFVRGHAAPFAADMTRCFGAMLVAMAFIEWRAIRRFRRSALTIVLQGLMLGDLTFLTNFLALPRSAGHFPAAAFVTVIAAIAIIVARGYFLARTREIPDAPAPPRLYIPRQ